MVHKTKTNLIMKIRNYEKNHNKKLFCNHFADVQLNSTELKKGDIVDIRYKNIYMGSARVNDIYKTKLIKIPEMTCLHATGLTKVELFMWYGNLMNELHLTNENPDIFIISYSYITNNFNAYALPNE